MTHPSLPYAHTEVPATEVLDRLLDRTKGQLFFKKGAGFLGSLLCDHRFVWDTDCDTAWCNGTTIGWNPQFFFWLTVEERVTVLAHELWHTGFDHMARLIDRCPDVWNKAADFVINWMLKLHGFVFGEKLMSLKPCLDSQYADMSTEQVYDLLPKPPGQPNPQCQDPNGKPLSGNQPQQGSDTPGLSGDLRSPDTSAGAEGSKEKRMSRLVKARQASMRAKEAGIVPGETELIIEEFLNPILPWDVLLMDWHTAFSQDDYSMARPNRRYEDIYLPCLMANNGLEHLIYYIDVSGSITDGTILRCNSEIKYIHDSLRPKRMTVVTFDTEIQDEYEFTDEDDFSKIVIHGRGGTDLNPVRRHIIKHMPTGAVIFSDLHVTPMTPDPKVPILWVIVGNRKTKPAFGQVAHIAEE